MEPTTDTRPIDPPQTHEDVLGVILAGGLSRRMGGEDKALIELGGRTLLAHVITRLEGQVGGLVVNANGDARRYDSYRLTVIADTLPDHPGPLAGILAGLEHAAANGWNWIATVPVDSPYIPLDLVDRLMTVLRGEQAELACARSGGRVHPVVGLWPVSLIETLRMAVAETGVRRVGVFTESRARAIANWSAEPYDPFLNVNSPSDLFEVEHGMTVD